jgi:PhoH-like ATPase
MRTTGCIIACKNIVSLKLILMAARKPKQQKIFVLDTSVILYNHSAIYSFDDNDVAIPITVLEELDNDTKNFEAREFIREMDRLSGNFNLTEWLPMGKKLGRFKVVMNTRLQGLDAVRILGEDKGDHRIINSALALAEEHKDCKVILVTKDINLRLKAKSLNLNAEDFETGKIKDVDSLYSGKSVFHGVNVGVIEQIYSEGFCRPEDIMNDAPIFNHYYILKNGKHSVLAWYNPASGMIERVEKTAAYGIRPRNAEQIFALHALMNPEIKLVTLQGVAGTGKTLLALSGALEQKREFRQIYLARPIVPLSNKDIGYLPGDIKSKLNPYMEPLWDNLKMIQNQWDETDREYKKITEMVDSEKLMITPLAYIRGRSLSNIYFIVDEAQNLTPHEVKTIITRAGENTKIVFTGDIFQIDTPYLDTQSNGLSYLIDKIKNNRLYAHITLEKGERSELANLANELL